MSDIYNPNNIPHSIPGGVVTFYHADGSAFTDAAAGVRTIEDITIDRDSVGIQRPNAYGGAGGFVIAGKPNVGSPAGKQITASGTVQVPTSAAADIINPGDYFEVNYTGVIFRFVAKKCGDAFKSEAYYKQSIEFWLDHYANGAVVG